MSTSENVEEPPEKRQRFAQLGNVDLDSLLDAAQAQSTKYNTAYSISVYEGKRLSFHFALN